MNQLIGRLKWGEDQKEDCKVSFAQLDRVLGEQTFLP
jgi:hypothetical protein